MMVNTLKIRNKKSLFTELFLLIVVLLTCTSVVLVVDVDMVHSFTIIVNDVAIRRGRTSCTIILQKLRSKLYQMSSSSSSNTETTTQSTQSIQQQQQLPPLIVSDTCQLVQLSKMTTLSIDSGDIELIQQYVNTGYITDATTNPLFVAQTALRNTETTTTTSTTTTTTTNTIYTQMVNDAVTYAINKLGSVPNNNNNSNEHDIVTLSMDRLAVNLGNAIASIVPGYISTEVDPRLSFNIDASVQRALQIIDMYEQDYNISKDRVLIKLAATWEGIMAAKILHDQYGIKCNLTLIFSIVQGIACAQYDAHLISPFPGRILDWYKVQKKRNVVTDPFDDEGVIACTYMYNYFKYYNHTTICMPASWRPSRGSTNDGTYDLDEIQALAGTDRMTIPVPLLSKLIQNETPLPRILYPDTVTVSSDPPPVLLGNGQITESEFRYLLAMDGCGNDKLAEGLRSFCDLTEQLQIVMTDKVRTVMMKQ